MNVININVSNQKITFIKPCELVAGTRGLYGVKVTYDEEWDETPHRLILFNGCKPIKVEDTGEVVAIPPESIASPCYLQFGLLGLDGDGNVRITTYSDHKDKITVRPASWHNGDEPDEETPPTPNIYEQILKKLESIQAGEVSQEEIAKAVEDYLAENPISGGVDETQVTEIVNKYITENADTLKGEKGETGEKGEKGDTVGYAPRIEGTTLVFDVLTDGNEVSY